MRLSLEAYRNIVKNVGSRADIAALCRVSRDFQRVAERALYNTLFMQDVQGTMALCATLASQPRVATHVDALTISLSETANEHSDDEEDSDDDEGDDISLDVRVEEAGPGERSRPTTPPAPPSTPQPVPGYDGSLPNDYWPSISRALQATVRLRYLNIYVNSNINTSTAWILDGCSFRLRSFHCDLGWDSHLVGFLSSQTDLDDLYIVDYNELSTDIPTPSQTTSPPLSPSDFSSSPSPPSTTGAPFSPASTSFDLPQPSRTTILDAYSLPKLSTIECTFAEAAIALVPSRPVSRLKTCFSRSDLNEKRTELNELFAKIGSSTGSFRALDIADSDYTEAFSMEMLQKVVDTQTTKAELRYLGTLVLPIGGRERLRFYALLMRLPRLQCLEVEVTDWQPPPTGMPALRALGGELRLYCPSVTMVVFVRDFDRTVITYVEGVCRLDTEASPELLWRDI